MPARDQSPARDFLQQGRHVAMFHISH